MIQSEIDIECTNLEFFLKTETRLEPLSIKRTMIAIKRLLRLNVLTTRETFLKYLLDRLDQGFDEYTNNKEISAVKHYLRYKGIKWAKINYFKPKVKNVPAPTQEEIKAILSVHTTDAFDMYWLLQTHCGTRPSEVLNLRRQDIDFNQQCFHPQKTKTNDGKPIILPPQIAKRLKVYVNNLPTLSPYLFTQSRHPNLATKPLSLAAAKKDLQKRLKEIGCNMPYTPHSFRHSYITIGIASGVPVQYISRSVRHTKIDTTMQYFDKSVDFAKRAAQAHPFYKQEQTTAQIIEDCISYIKKNTDDRFNPVCLQQVFAKLYESVQN